MKANLLVIALFLFINGYAQDYETYTNPIISGDWSDPGVVRVGEDYYSVRSTFGWTPGLHIAHSKDLIHWHYIGFADTMNAFNLSPGLTDPGIWGSDIGYNPLTKTFLVYAPARNEIRVFYAKDPAGPYSDGGIVSDGYDPGFFIDDDGTMYLTKTGGNIYKLSADGLRIDGEPIAQVAGGEGPEIFKHKGYYYYLISPGGTRPYQHHKIMSYRSRSIQGPWEEDPNNPVMYAPHTSNAKLQGPGHGEVFKTHNGEWYLTYHAYDITNYSLGRQTALEPVEWTKDGWWKPVNGRIPSEKNPFPLLKPVPYKIQDSDEFDSATLGKQWFFHTQPDYTGKTWSLSKQPGCLRINTVKGDISTPAVSKGVFLQRVTYKKFEFISKVTFNAINENESAGIHLYHDPSRNIWLVTTCVDGKKYFEVGYYDKPFPSDENPHELGYKKALEMMKLAKTEKNIVARIANDIGNTVYLKMIIDKTETVNFAYSANGKNWNKIDAEIYFGESWHYALQGKKPGAPDLGWVGLARSNVWTATVMGIFAAGGTTNQSNFADFDFFRVTKK